MSDTNPAIKIAVLEEKFSVTTRAIDRIDSAIEKIAETNQHILKMLALHDEKISNGEKNGKYFSREIEEVKIECEANFKEVTEKVNTIDEKVSELVKIKWMTIGMATLLVVLIGGITQLAGGIISKDDLIRTHQTEVK